jgi:hypothetical protein
MDTKRERNERCHVWYLVTDVGVPCDSTIGATERLHLDLLCVIPWIYLRNGWEGSSAVTPLHLPRYASLSTFTVHQYSRRFGSCSVLPRKAECAKTGAQIKETVPSLRTTLVQITRTKSVWTCINWSTELKLFRLDRILGVNEWRVRQIHTGHN